VETPFLPNHEVSTEAGQLQEDIKRGFGRSSFTSDYGNRAITAAGQVDAVRARYRTLALQMIGGAGPKVVRTDVNGRFEFKDAPAGPYYLVAEHRVFDNEFRWKVHVEVKSGDANHINLSNSNAGWPF